MRIEGCVAQCEVVEAEEFVVLVPEVPGVEVGSILIAPEIVLAVVVGLDQRGAVARFVVEFVLIFELDAGLLACLLLFIWFGVIVVIGSSMRTL